MPKIKGIIVGDKALRDKLKKMGQAVVRINSDAAMSGAELIEDAAQSRAPGPYIFSVLVEADENRAVVDIGPDEAHWHYRFSETGATTHEIKPGRTARRTVRLAYGGRAPKSELQSVTATARLAFMGRKGLVITRAVKHPGIAASPFLRPAMSQQKNAAKEKAGQVFRLALEKVANNGS